MKKHLTLILIIQCFQQPVWAQGSITVELEPSITLVGSYYRHKSGGGLFPSEWNAENSTKNRHSLLPSYGPLGNFVTTRELQYFSRHTRTGYNSGNSDQGYLARRLRIGLEINNEPETGASVLSAKVLEDYQAEQFNDSWSRKKRWPGRSRHYRINSRFVDDLIKGKIQFKYQVPDNVWAIKVSRGSYEGDFLRERSTKLEGAFNSYRDKGLPATEQIMFVRPGEVINQSFGFNNVSLGRSVRGGFEITIEPIDFSHFNKSTTAQLISDIINDADARNYITDKAAASLLFNRIMEIRVNPSRIDKALNSLPTSKVGEFLDVLYRLANETERSEGIYEIKAGATMLGYELAIRFLTGFTPFCKEQTIKLPYTQKTANVLGLRLASYLQTRAYSRILSINVAHLRAMAEGLSEYNGESYSSVSADSETSDAIDTAIEVLFLTANMRLSPSNAAINELNYLYDMYGQLGVGRIDSDTVIGELKNLHSMEMELNSSVIQFLGNFKVGNNGTVDTSHLSDQIASYETKKKEVASHVETSLQLINNSNGDPGGEFFDLILDVLIHNLEMIAAPLDGPFESFRAQYVSESRVTSLREDLKHCIDN